ncbi:hypothetical protein AURDEDRAFT_177400 [Auricularia subglabra TFB-10046 SS5]|uniref:Uncharacterized protein n=1 Tax=Auricularia subglabra (strain TFB-10046 / SS5) TaxID=717982 RepID=J0CT95_AURST|nr:hypothetical protein AURDEDRAFT_177400 [Auricularia subglabra TFB-10046 SS5]
MVFVRPTKVTRLVECLRVERPVALALVGCVFYGPSVASAMDRLFTEVEVVDFSNDLVPCYYDDLQWGDDNAAGSKSPLFFPDALDDEPGNESSPPKDIQELLERRDLPEDDSLHKFHEELLEDFADDGDDEVDEDGAPIAYKEEIWACVYELDKKFEEFAVKFNQPLSTIHRVARLVMKDSRAPNPFNLFVTWWYLENTEKGRMPDTICKLSQHAHRRLGSPEEPREKFCEAYHAKVDPMIVEVKVEYQKELKAWSEAYDKENSKGI